MTKYDVYGVGNALVDTEFEVPDSFFAEHNIQKGFMTLVSYEQQKFLVNLLMQKYHVKKQSGGGSAGNTMSALTQFGGKAFYACKVANDETGDFFLEQLGDHNIDTSVNEREEGTSGQCLIMVSPDAERTMNTFLGVSETLSINEIDFEAVKQSNFIYIEGYLVTSPSAKSAIVDLKEFANKNEIKTAFTFSDPSMLEYFKDSVNEVLGDGVDLLFCNEQELKLWAGNEDFNEACKTMESIANQFAVTRGPKGAMLFDGETYISIAGNPVQAIDTNGAGDMFAGAFLYAISQGENFETAGKLASLASSEVVTVFGPRLKAEQHRDIAKRALD